MNLIQRSCQNFKETGKKSPAYYASKMLDNKDQVYLPKIIFSYYLLKTAFITFYDKETNNRWSVDTKDTGLKGPGTNWTEVRDPHHTNQNDNSHDDEVRWGESTKVEKNDNDKNDK